MWNVVFFINSILLGVALAMDAFSVSIANGLAEPKMKRGKTAFVAGTYAFFQFLMPMIGWALVRFLVQAFQVLEGFIPWIALLLLSFLGVKAILETVEENKKGEANEGTKTLAISTLMVQGVATSIDALSVGLTIEGYGPVEALVSSLIIAVVTFAICLFGLFVGKTVGKKFSYAGVLGAVILIAIGLEICISHFI